MTWQAVALLVTVVLQLLLARYWLDLIDEGYFADLAGRVMNGELPYRDFSTPYTPAVHYLHALAFQVLGRDVVSMRLVLVVAKTALVVLLYLLGRRLMPAQFAVLPIILLFALDTVPFMWEPHPAWYALLFAVAATYSMVRLIESGNDRWLVAAGIFAAASASFKQNIGLFVLIALASFLLFRSAELPAGRARLLLPALLHARWVWRLARAVYALALLAALTWLLRPYLEPRVATLFLLPMVFLATVGYSRAAQLRETATELDQLAGRLGLLSLSFAVATLVWLGPLVLAVGPTNFPLGQFVGALDLSGFYWELIEPRIGFCLFLVVAVACPIAVQRFCRTAPFPRRLLEGAATFLFAAVATDLAIADIALATPDLPGEYQTFWQLSLRGAETVLIYLPSLAFWGANVGLVASRAQLTSTTRLTLSWLLLSGALLLYNLYPRMDTMHVTFSAPVLFVLGAFALWRLYLALDHRPAMTPARPIKRVLLFAALLVLPVAAALPNLDWRVRTIVSETDGELRFDPPDYVPFDHPGANVLVPASSRDAIGGAARYVQERTAPGEPIFVYPTVPLFYFLAERPNPTPFGHVYPGAATAQEQAEMIVTMEARRVRYVIWDQYWVNEWGANERYRQNLPLTDYLLSTYRVETMVGPFHILVRSE